MKKWLSFLTLAFFASGLLAQRSEDTLRLQKTNAAELPWRSAIQPLDSPRIWGFLGISAYARISEGPRQLYIRYRQDKLWSPWRAMPGPDHGKAHRRLSWIAVPRRETAQAFQLASPMALHVPLVVRCFKAPPPEKKSPSPALSPTLNPDNSCGCPPPPICDRACWCPDGTCPPPTYSSHNPTHLVVHHSAGFTNYPDYQWVVSYYWDLHVNTNGWSDIGYNWLIDPNGVVYEGRGLGHVGAHFSCMNTGTSGICLIGNFMDTVPSDTALASLAQLASYLACQHQIYLADSSLHNSSQLVLPHFTGHRAANVAQQGCPSGTVCPGDSLYPMLDSLATRMAAKACLQGLGHASTSSSPFEIYPQPARARLHLRWPGAAPRQITLYSPTGRLVQKLQVQQQELSFSLQGMAGGLYLLKVEGPTGSTYRPVVVNRP